MSCPRLLFAEILHKYNLEVVFRMTLAMERSPGRDSFPIGISPSGEGSYMGISGRGSDLQAAILPCFGAMLPRAGYGVKWHGVGGMNGLGVFFPKSILDLMAPALDGRHAFKLLEGSVMFCDVAGFTPLTEALAVLGREGSEELTRLINSYFTRMIAIVGAAGGDILGFGGDAMSVFFEGGSVSAALSATSEMMACMGEFQEMPTRAGNFSLSMKIGLAAGAIQVGLLGDRSSGFGFYAAGTPLDHAAEAEHHAKPGQAVCHPSVKYDFGHSAGFEDLAGGFKLLRMQNDPGAWVRKPHRGTVPCTDLAISRDGELSQIVPDYLAERVSGELVGEHRGTSVLFLSWAKREGDPVRVEGDGGGLLHAELDGLFKRFSATARRYGGIVSRLDMGDKGSKALFLFGSPRAVERREEMSVRCAVDLLSAKGVPPGISFKMGLTSSPLFSGPVGSPERREFTVMGDGINLAARLMQAAEPGQVLCDSVTAGEAGGAFEFAALSPIQVKGKRGPVPIFQPSREVEPAQTIPVRKSLLGREEICRELRTYILQGGKSLLLSGQAGIGKTAILEWLSREFSWMRPPLARVSLAPYSAEQPYAAWRVPAMALVGIERDDTGPVAREKRDDALSEEPAGYRPLLNQLLGLPEESTPALKNLSPKEKKDLAFAMLGRLFACCGERIFILDNLQWADPLSIDFLEYLLRENPSPKWRLVAAARDAGGQEEQLLRLLRRFEVHPFSRIELEEFLKEAMLFSDIPPAFLDWAAAKSGGNPALMTALVDALQNTGLTIDDDRGRRVDHDRLFATSFPDTLEGLYLAKVDRLPASERKVLQHASILGTSVSMNLLSKLSNLSDGELAGALVGLTDGGLMRADTWGKRAYYIFGDALLRDAIYNSLSFSLKREGHLKLASILEEAESDNPKVRPALAEHYEQAGCEEKARLYHRLAGRDALARFDNLSALKHLEYVCRDILAEEGKVKDALDLVDVYWRLGKPEDASRLVEMLAALDHDLPVYLRGRLRNYTSEIKARRGEWKEAEALLVEGKTFSKESGDIEGQAKALVNLVGRVYGPTGRLEEARRCLEAAMALPSGPDQSVWRAMAAMNLGGVYWFSGQYSHARRTFMEAYLQCSRGRLGPQKGMVAYSMSALLCEMGMFKEAKAWGAKAVSLLKVFNLRKELLTAMHNMAIAELACGYAERVLPVFQQVEEKSDLLGNRLSKGLALQGITFSDILMGRFEHALNSASESLSVFKGIENGRDYRFTLAGTSNFFYSIGDRAGAKRFWEGESCGDFLMASGSDPSTAMAMERVESWMNGGASHIEDPEAFLGHGQEMPPEEKLERLLWACEGLSEVGCKERAREYYCRLQDALKDWPYFDCRLRALRLGLLLGEADMKKKMEARRLLSRGMGGVWGLRLLCLLAGQESDKIAARNLRRRALRHLYSVHLNSPPHVWTNLMKFPEIREVLRGKKAPGD